MSNSSLSEEDIRAAVASGILPESQAANLITFSQQRAGFRDNLRADDEPFEFFRGFNEIFISFGLVLFYSGLVAMGGISIIGTLLVFPAAYYFARKRRMVLPSITLAILLAVSVATGAQILSDYYPKHSFFTPLFFPFLILATSLLYYWLFKVPFSLFIAGFSGLWLLLKLTGTIATTNSHLSFTRWFTVFDFSEAPYHALTTLAYGLVLFTAAMAFDLRDRYRLSRYSSCAFWLHLVAAPAIIHPLAFTLLRQETDAAFAVLGLLVTLLATIALIIDRRSFLLSGALYMITMLISYALQKDMDEGLTFAAVFIGTGSIVIWLGAKWTTIRSWLMNRLPNFPKKDQLPIWHSID